MFRLTLNEIMKELPFSIREEIGGYLASVELNATSIFEESKVQLTKERLDKFIFLVGLRRIWTMVDTQYWILDNCLSLVQENQVKDVTIGSLHLSKDSEGYNRMKDFRHNFYLLLIEIGFIRITDVKTMGDIISLVEEGVLEC